MNINEKISKDGDQGAEKSLYHLQGPSKNKEIKPGMEGRVSHRIDPVWEMPWTVGILPNIVEGLSWEAVISQGRDGAVGSTQFRDNEKKSP